MGNFLGGLFLLVAALVVIALAISAFAIITAITVAIYAVTLPSSYLLTVSLLLKRGPRSELELADNNSTGKHSNEQEHAAADSPSAANPAVPRRDRREDRQELSTLFEPPQLHAVRRRVWLGPHEDQDIARPSYFFGPAADDIEGILRGCEERCRFWFRLGADLVGELTDDDEARLGYVAAAGVVIGMVVGGVVGLVGVAALAVLNLVMAALVVMAGFMVCGALRIVDSIRRLIYIVRMPCPRCHHAVRPYPIYLCPSCSEQHRDVRPGPFGIAFRTCMCEARFPTSMLTGAANLVAACPHCGARLPQAFGMVPEIVIPFFGGLNAGKTQLMYSLTRALRALVAANGGTVDFEDDAEERLHRIWEQLLRNGMPDKTRPETPKAYVLKLSLGSEQRLIYLFDAAGELHYNLDGLSQLNYLDKARILVFVADPLAADDIWEEISEDSREKLASIRSSKAEGELAYQKTRERMLRMGSKRKYARLALVVSKADLLEEVGVMPMADADKNSARDLVQRRGGLDMADEVREASQSFASVEFFHTAAVIGDYGLPDSSVEDLACWLMRSEGIRLQRWAADSG